MIQWKNKKVYSKNDIQYKLNIINKHMNGLLPLYGKEKEYLEELSEKLNVSRYEIFSLRNLLKIQKEISNSRFLNKESIQDNFIQFVQNKSITKLDIRNFLKSFRVSIGSILKIIFSMVDYNDLSISNQQYLHKIKEGITKENNNIKIRSSKFEKDLENFLKNSSMDFLTEEQIKESNVYSSTPDILFEESISIRIDGKEYVIYWMDAKDYILVDFPFIIKSLKKQAKRYYEEYGLGAFVFHYGFDESIIIPNAIILDAQKIYNL